MTSYEPGQPRQRLVCPASGRRAQCRRARIHHDNNHVGSHGRSPSSHRRRRCRHTREHASRRGVFTDRNQTGRHRDSRESGRVSSARRLRRHLRCGADDGNRGHQLLRRRPRPVPDDAKQSNSARSSGHGGHSDARGSPTRSTPTRPRSRSWPTPTACPSPSPVTELSSRSECCSRSAAALSKRE